jgi:hypothetical protein
MFASSLSLLSGDREIQEETITVIHFGEKIIMPMPVFIQKTWLKIDPLECLIERTNILT